MYEAKNCIICKKLFQDITAKDICPSCEEKDDFNLTK
jgi:rRNA maturation endonuclease Nob1